MTGTTIRVAVSSLTGDSGCMVWEQIKRFDSDQDAANYIYRMGKIYGQNFDWWVRP